ncbi:MAG: peptide chain release factor N(5)-glutamine methyltransferase [Verrucomicrobia bacterium]|nr:MAG: peptide chain release factor N(5)-glutamine methyltransferase [Verrucomicrobiota bacterium]
MVPPVTVLEVIQRSADFLTKKGVDSPRLQAELLLAHRLKLPRMKLYLNFEQKLTDAELSEVRELVQRRGRREPLQQIVGSTSFCGLEIAVNRHVLVPRPETELLAERGWEFLKNARGKAGTKETEETEGPTGTRAALDFGTGSGCLAIALAIKNLQAHIWALDQSSEALEIARQNASRHGVTDRIQFLQSKGLSALSPEQRFDLIISNPPYIPSGEIAALQPEVHDYEPKEALDGGADGLDFYRMLGAEARPFLQKEGRMMLEFGAGQADALRQIFESQNWIVESIVEDYNQHPRIVILKHGQFPN